jgi:hypothetical protein
MTTDHTLPDLAFLLPRLAEDALTPATFRQLEHLLDSDASARTEYRRHMAVHAMLYWRWHNRDRGQALSAADIHGGGIAEFDAQPPLPHDLPQAWPAGIAPWPPHLFSPGSDRHGAFGYLDSGWPVAYLVATVVFAIGFLVGAVVHVSQPPHVVRDSVPQPAVFAPNPTTVARITAMVDCEWEGAGSAEQDSGANQKSEIRNPNSLLRLGDRLALRSGLLEITYKTGAKVILQGPAVYEVEAENGGLLSRGTLTGKATSARSHGLTIRSPTATVVDLGTEFGVDVADESSTTVHVFAGSVNVVGCPTGASKTIAAGETMHVHSGVPGRVERETTPKNFIRVVPLTLPQLPLTDNFDGDTIDWTKWRVHLLPFGGSHVVQDKHRIRLTNRGYLITRNQYPPDMFGGITVSGRWKAAKKRTTSLQMDILQILTRSDGIPESGNGETQVGLEFTVDDGASNDPYAAKRAVIRARGDLAIRDLVQTGALAIRDRGNYWFAIVDRGSAGLSVTITEIENPANTASATAVLTADNAGCGYVVFHNLAKVESDGSDPGNHLTYLDDITIAPAKPDGTRPMQ